MFELRPAFITTALFALAACGGPEGAELSEDPASLANTEAAIENHFTAYSYVSNDDKSATGTGCSAAVFSPKSEAKDEAKDAARSDLAASCDSTWHSDSWCDSWCTANTSAISGTTGVTNVTYTTLQSSKCVNGCTWWYKVRATGNCGCACYY